MSQQSGSLGSRTVREPAERSVRQQNVPLGSRAVREPAERPVRQQSGPLGSRAVREPAERPVRQQNVPLGSGKFSNSLRGDFSSRNDRFSWTMSCVAAGTASNPTELSQLIRTCRREELRHSVLFHVAPPTLVLTNFTVPTPLVICTPTFSTLLVKVTRSTRSAGDRQVMSPMSTRPKWQLITLMFLLAGRSWTSCL